MAQKYLTIKEYSKLTHISENTLRTNFRAGKLKNATKIGGRIKIIVDFDEEAKESGKLKQEKLAKAYADVANAYNELALIIKNL